MINRVIVLASIFCVTFAHALGGETEAVQWLDDLDAVWAKHVENKKPVLVKFSASWCQPCRIMNSTTLKDEKVMEQLSHFNLLTLDLDLNNTQALEWGVRGVPAFLVLNEDKKPLRMLMGYRESEPFLGWLLGTQEVTQSFLEEARATDSKFERLKKEIASVSDKKRNAALRELFEMVETDRDLIQERAKELIFEIAMTDSASVRPGLHAKSLAVRIVAAKALTQAGVELKDYDPWQVPEG